MVSQNKRRPKGSPCCTPSADWIVSSSQNREDGEEYAEWAKAASSVVNFWIIIIDIASQHSASVSDWGGDIKSVKIANDRLHKVVGQLGCNYSCLIYNQCRVLRHNSTEAQKQSNKQ